MSEDRIDSIIDLTATQKEVDALELQIKKVVELIKSTKEKSVEVTTAKSVAEYNKLNKELGSLVQQTDAASKSVVKSTQSIKEQTDSLNENIKKQTEYKERIKEITSELKQLEAAQKIVSTSTAPGNEEEKKAIAEKINLLNQELTVKKILDKEITKTITNQVKEVEGINNVTKSLSQQQKEREKEAKATEKQAAASEKAARKAQEEARPYRQLALAFAAAAKEAQDLAVKYGRLDPRSQAAARRANELNNELKKIDATIGNHQRNVGNYGSALDGLGTKLRNLATGFLALLGITSLGSFFSSSIDAFVEMEKNVKQLENTLKNLGVPEAFGRIETSANRLAKQFKFLDDDEILKTFNQLIIYGKLTEDQINDLIPVIVDFSAATGKDLAESTSIITKALEGNSRGLREFGINMKDASGTTEAFSLIMKELKPRVDGMAQSFADSASGGLAAAKQEFKDLKEEIGEGLLPALNGILDFFNKAVKGMREFGKDFRLYMQGGPAAVAAQFALDVQKGVDENIKQMFGTLSTLERGEKIIEFQLAIEEQNKLLQSLQSGSLAKEGLGTEKRLAEVTSKIAALKNTLKILFEQQFNSGDGKKILGVGEPTAPKAKTDDSAKKAEELVERIRKANFEAAKAAQLENIKLQEEIFKDETKSFDVRIAALREFVQEKVRLIELERQFEKGAKGLTKEEIVAIETQKQTELNQLVRDGHQEYNRILKAEQDKEAKLHKENAERIKKIHEDLQKDIEEGLKDANNRLQAILKEREDIEKEAANLRAELANEGIGLAFDLLTAQYEHEKNLIQDQIDLLERKKQKEIEVANATITNLQDRAAAITIINDRAAAEEAILEQKKRQVSIKEAQFEKAESIANIIAKTAEAIIASLAKTPPPAGLPLAFLIGAIGAAQLARVIATPIPRYAEGVGVQPKEKGHPGGAAIVGERKDKTPELVEEPNGKTYIVTKPTLLEKLPKGSRVVPLTIENKKIIEKQKESTRVMVSEVRKEIYNNSIPAYKNGVGAVIKPTWTLSVVKPDSDIVNNVIDINRNKTAEPIKLPDGTLLKSSYNTVTNNRVEKTYHDFKQMMLKSTLTNVPVFKETTRSDKTEAAVLKMEKSVVSAIKKIPQPITLAENIISRKIRNTTQILRSN